MPCSTAPTERTTDRKQTPSAERERRAREIAFDLDINWAVMAYDRYQREHEAEHDRQMMQAMFLSYLEDKRRACDAAAAAAAARALARSIDASKIDQHPRWSRLPDDLIRMVLDFKEADRAERLEQRKAQAENMHLDECQPCRFGYQGMICHMWRHHACQLISFCQLTSSHCRKLTDY